MPLVTLPQNNSWYVILENCMHVAVLQIARRSSIIFNDAEKVNTWINQKSLLTWSHPKVHRDLWIRSGEFETSTSTYVLGRNSLFWIPPVMAEHCVGRHHFHYWLGQCHAKKLWNVAAEVLDPRNGTGNSACTRNNERSFPLIHMIWYKSYSIHIFPALYASEI